MPSENFYSEATKRLKVLATNMDVRQDRFGVELKQLNALRIPLFWGAGTLGLALGVALGYRAGQR